jgi:hypothetical protein
MEFGDNGDQPNDISDQAHAEQSNSEFVEQLYHDILGRESDAGGAAWWNKALEHGASREEVMQGFYNSDEYKASHAAEPEDSSWTQPGTPQISQSQSEEPEAKHEEDDQAHHAFGVLPDSVDEVSARENENIWNDDEPRSMTEHFHAAEDFSDDHENQAIEPVHHIEQAQPIVHHSEPLDASIVRSNGMDIHAMPLTDSRAMASLDLQPISVALAEHGDSAFKLQEGSIMINGMNGHGLEMGRVQIPGTVELGTHGDLREIRANRNASVIDAHNERLQTDQQFAADWYHTRALAGVASVTKDFYEFADDILKKNGVDGGMTDPKVANVVGYSEEKGVVVRVGSVFTNQLMNAYQNKYDADNASFMEKYGFMIVLGVMTGAIGSGIAATAAAANSGVLATAVEVLGEKAVAGTISSALNGALTGNFNFESLAISAFTGAVTNGLTDTIVKADIFSADTSALAARVLVNTGADLLQNGDLGHALQAGVSTVAKNYVPIVKDIARETLGEDAVQLIGQAAAVANFVNNPVGAITGELGKWTDKEVHKSLAEQTAADSKKRVG